MNNNTDHFGCSFVSLFFWSFSFFSFFFSSCLAQHFSSVLTLSLLFFVWPHFLVFGDLLGLNENLCLDLLFTVQPGQSSLACAVLVCLSFFSVSSDCFFSFHFVSSAIFWIVLMCACLFLS